MRTKSEFEVSPSMSIKNRPDVSDLSCKIISCYNYNTKVFSMIGKNHVTFRVVKENLKFLSIYPYSSTTDMICQAHQNRVAQKNLQTTLFFKQLGLKTCSD